MRERLRALSRLALLLGLALPANVAGEPCTERFWPGKCKATQDYVLVVDNSASMSAICTT